MSSRNINEGKTAIGIEIAMRGEIKLANNLAVVIDTAGLARAIRTTWRKKKSTKDAVIENEAEGGPLDASFVVCDDLASAVPAKRINGPDWETIGYDQRTEVERIAPRGNH